jgi:hypothetical protein
MMVLRAFSDVDRVSEELRQTSGDEGGLVVETIETDRSAVAAVHGSLFRQEDG